MRQKLLASMIVLAIATTAAVAKSSWLQDQLSGSDGKILTAFSLIPGREQTALMANKPPRIGTNLDGLAYWSTAVPLLDLMKSSSPWLPQAPGKWDTREKLDLDEHGWVRSLPDRGPATHRTAGLVVLRDAGSAAPPRARYVILYEGEGTIGGMDGQGTKTISKDAKNGRVVVQAADNGSLHLSLSATDPKKSGNYIRNIRIVREDRVTLIVRGELFNPDFLRIVRPFGTIRFMDWMSTNKLYRANGTPLEWRTPGGYDVGAPVPLNWVDRPKMSDAIWNRGVPVEAMVELANETGADPWFNMPINASDNYVSGFADYVHSRLNPDAAIHVELSNEVWNWAFVQSKYAEARAKEATGIRGNWMEWYGRRAAEVGAIWNREFGERATGPSVQNRVRVVYGTQLVYKGLETPGLETPNWKRPNGKANRGADYFDEYAVTGYYGAGMSDPKNVPKVLGWWSKPDGGYSSALHAIADEVETKTKSLYLYHSKRAEAYGLDLVTYESGFGERTPDNQANNRAYTDFLISLQRRPEIHSIEIANYRAFQAAGGKLFMNFGIVGKPSRWGSWSALEAVDQASSPRYRALIDMIGLSGARPKLRPSAAPTSRPLLKQSPGS